MYQRYQSVGSYSAAPGVRGCGGWGWYLHYIGVLPQFFATGGVVGHLALRPPRHRFDPRFSSPPDVQGDRRHDGDTERTWRARLAALCGVNCGRRRAPRRVTHPNFSGIISSFSSITLFLFPKPARRSTINCRARAEAGSPCAYTKSPDTRAGENTRAI